VVCGITNGIVLVVLNLRGILQMLKVKHRIILSSVVTLAHKKFGDTRYVLKYVSKYIYIYIYICLQIKHQFASSGLELAPNSKKQSS